MVKAKSHKAFAKDHWLKRLQQFAACGHWKPEFGSRPGPRQPKAVQDLYEKVSVLADATESLAGIITMYLCQLAELWPRSSSTSS